MELIGYILAILGGLMIFGFIIVWVIDVIRFGDREDWLVLSGILGFPLIVIGLLFILYSLYT